MHNLTVVLKSGKTHSGWLVQWCPKEGWFSMGDEDDGGLYQIDLANVVSAVQKGNRISIHRIEDEDMLARAKRDGWIE